MISIITINLNNAKGLEKTLKSISSQTYKNFELIVIDGISSDGSHKVVEQNKEIISKSLIEKDKGLYDAMNKGIDLANGNYALFLNSGDVFNNIDSLKTIINNFDNKEKLYFGRASIEYNGEHLYHIPGLDVTEINYKQNVQTSHQSVFFPKSFYKKNYYNLDYKVAADVDYKLRALEHFEYKFIDIIVVRFGLGGISSIPKSFAFWRQIINEVSTIKKKNGTYNCYSSFVYSSKYYLKYLAYKTLGQERYFKLIGYFLNRKN